MCLFLGHKSLLDPQPAPELQLWLREETLPGHVFYQVLFCLDLKAAMEALFSVDSYPIVFARRWDPKTF